MQIVGNIILNEDYVGPGCMHSVYETYKTIFLNSSIFTRISCRQAPLCTVVDDKPMFMFHFIVLISIHYVTTHTSRVQVKLNILSSNNCSWSAIQHIGLVARSINLQQAKLHNSNSFVFQLLDNVYNADTKHSFTNFDSPSIYRVIHLKCPTPQNLTNKNS